MHAYLEVLNKHHVYLELLNKHHVYLVLNNKHHVYLSGTMRTLRSKLLLGKELACKLAGLALECATSSFGSTAGVV